MVDLLTLDCCKSLSLQGIWSRSFKALVTNVNQMSFRSNVNVSESMEINCLLCRHVTLWALSF